MRYELAGYAHAVRFEFAAYVCTSDMLFYVHVMRLELVVFAHVVRFGFDSLVLPHCWQSFKLHLRVLRVIFLCVRVSVFSIHRHNEGMLAWLFGQCWLMECLTTRTVIF